MALLSLIHACLQQFGLAKLPGLAAVSGGADSVALAHALLQLKSRGDLAGLALVHLNHCLRGVVSDEDERFVQSLPSEWQATDMPVYSQRRDVAALALEKHRNLEDAGRRARYGYFTQVAEETGAAWVATGHTLDDQAETVLLRLIRGAGLKGLGGMPPLRPLGGSTLLVRPLLGVRRAELRVYLNDHGLRWRDDSSNDEPRFQRNRVRRELLPLLEENYNHAIVPLLGRNAEQARELQAYIEGLATDLLTKAEKPRAGDILVFDVAALATAAPLLVREMFRLVWRREGYPTAEMGWPEWCNLAAMATAEGKDADYPGGIHVRRKGGVLQIHGRARPS